MFNVYFLYVVISYCVELSSYVSCGVLPKADLFTLNIIHYNDFHDRFEETSVLYPICKSNDTNCIGGFARLYQAINDLANAKPGALVLNAGDTYQGTYWYTTLKWKVILKFINMLPNDVHAIGNHEFDDGVEGLAPYLAGLKAPVVAANIDTSKEPSLNGLLEPHTVIERNGRKIGIIGLITPMTQISSNAGGVIFFDPVKTAAKEAQILTDKGIDIIILLSHCGLNVDIDIAKNVGENIDVIVGGHSHSLLWNGKSPSNESIDGPYPILIEANAKPGHKVLIVTASAYSKYLGFISTVFDEEGELQSFNGEPMFLNRSIPEDPQVLELLQPYKDELHKLLNQVVGFTEDDLVVEDCSGSECAIGDLTADAFLNATKELKHSSHPHVAFILRNMIRGSLQKGNITRGAIINALPFTNKVTTFILKGRYLVKAIERGLATSWREKPFIGPWFPQIAGAELVLNTTKKEVVSISVKENDQYIPLQPDRDYQITTLDFLIRGGNGFTVLKENSRDIRLIGKDSDVLENYIRKMSHVTPSIDNRITVLN